MMRTSNQALPLRQTKLNFNFQMNIFHWIHVLFMTWSTDLLLVGHLWPASSFDTQIKLSIDWLIDAE